MFAALGDVPIWAENVEDDRINMNDMGIPTLQPVERVLDLMSVYLPHPCCVSHHSTIADPLRPVGLKEAALDSPTFRSTTSHLSDQFDILERWLEEYVKSGTRLTQDAVAFESSVNSWLQHTIPPSTVGQAALDFDYTLLAAQKYSRVAAEAWQSTFRTVRRHETRAIDAIRVFLTSDLQTFKETKRTLTTTQRVFDHILARHSGQTRSKEPSSLREGAFQLHEARKAYLKAAMDFCIQGALIRAALDKLLVKAFTDKFNDLRAARDDTATLFRETGPLMDRIRGWGNEMQDSERAFERDLHVARRQIEDAAELAMRPSRELEDYADKTAAYASSNTPTIQKAEKQGWLFQKTLLGKPTRMFWNRRWVFVKNGILGWLVPGRLSGGVEESEKIGLLLCSVRPASTEERRFCFEVKTKDSTLIFQAETQAELLQWIDVFEVAKRKALQDPGNAESPTFATGVDAAFSISPPIAHELSATATGHVPSGSEDALGVSDPFIGNTRNSVDAPTPRRSTLVDREEGSWDHASRIIQKLDLHRKTTPSSSSHGTSGGIASLISASHNTLPVGPGPGISVPTPVTPGHLRNFSEPPTTLAPHTFANPPAPTNLSRVAVTVSGERGVSIGGGTGMPSGIMANLWGSEKWGQVNRLERDIIENAIMSHPTSPMPGSRPISRTGSVGDHLTKLHRASTGSIRPVRLDESWYPPALKKQDAQFRLLFPGVHRDDKVVLVFRATWNPNEHQEFPGRVYVTARELYFYSSHLGFVLITGVGLTTVTEVTAAPGRDCDFLYVHLKDGSRTEGLRRVTIKTFLEPLTLLRRRLNYLVENANAVEPANIDEIIKHLLHLESANDKGADHSDIDETDRERSMPAVGHSEHEVKPALRIDDRLYGSDTVGRTGREINKFKLPERAVSYIPDGMGKRPLTRDFDTSAKALFHIMFGDKSAVFQTVYLGHGAQKVTQNPWIQSSTTGLRRTIDWQLRQHDIKDVQTIEINNDHLCYVVTGTPSTWNYPQPAHVKFIIKYIITHVAKSRCRLAIYHQQIWQSLVIRSHITRLVERRASRDLEHDARNIMHILGEQVESLGPRHTTNRAIQIYGAVGLSTEALSMTHESMKAVPAAQRRVVVYTVPGLYSREILRQVFRVSAIVLNFVNTIIRAICNTIDGNRLITILLTVSVIYNLSYAYIGGSSWYQERSAAKYMSRLGVGKSTMVNAGIYLRDMDELVVPHNKSVKMPLSTCRSKFQDVLTTATGNDASRWTAVRDRLAQRRYQTLLSLRVINRIDQEAQLSQWAEWVRKELKMCMQTNHVLESGAQNAGEEAAEPFRAVGNELMDYCLSCQGDSETLQDGRMI